ncbi:MAG: ABC transporter ATP-binding protein [Acidimicrobiaceae bacterium]|nr:ABC transporter ATP-binding protein [Acidimicrobiaceae bacterium]
MDQHSQRGTVSLRKVTKRFGDAVAVNAVNLEVEAGEFISLLGPSGCGKTTTLRMISGFELPTEGRVHISGRDATDTPPHLRTVNSVFQSYALFGHMTVAENVAFGLRVKRRDKPTIERKVQETLDLVQLSDFGSRFPGQLSGGQQQRVALARAVINEPDVLLLDEPLSALDLKLRQAMRYELTRLHDELAMTFVFVTHDQTEAITMSDRIAVMDQGEIHQLGTPVDIYERPATRFVAEFIGEVNMLEATVVGGDGTRTEVLLSSGDRLTCAPVGDSRLTPGVSVVLTVRPQRVLLTPEGGIDSQEHASLRGELRELLFLGDSTRGTVGLADGTELVAVRHNEDGTHPFGTLRPGDRVDVGWRHGTACLVQ